MPKYQRPTGAYGGASGLANRTKYQDDAGASPRRAISSSKMDGDLNYLLDAANETWEALAGASFASSLPSQTGNANRVPVTNGTNTSWQLVSAANVQDASLGVSKLAPLTANSVVGAGSSGTATALTLGGGLSIAGGVLMGGGLPSGMVMPYAGSLLPDGWLWCAGQAVSRSTYAALFTAIGVLHGAGDGSTTFGLPDLRGRTVFGKDDLGGTAANRVTNAVSGIAATTLGASGGNQNMHGHTHTVTDPGHSHGLGHRTSPFGMTTGAGGVPPINDSTGLSTTSTTTGITLASTGSGSSQNMPPALILNYVIKT